MGRAFRYKTAEDLRKDADGYFSYCDRNPIRGQRTLKKDTGEVETRDEQFPRPYTFEGLSLYLNIPNWSDFVSDNKKRGADFEEVFGYIRNKVRCCQIEGGMVGIYREGLTARLNGIAENMNLNDKPAINLRADEQE